MGINFKTNSQFIHLEALIGLLLAIAQQEPKVCKASHIKAFMTAYNATLSKTG